MNIMENTGLDYYIVMVVGALRKGQFSGHFDTRRRKSLVLRNEYVLYRNWVSSKILIGTDLAFFFFF